MQKVMKIRADFENPWQIPFFMNSAPFWHNFWSNMLWGLPGRAWEVHGPSRGALGAALGRPRRPWGGSRGALGAFRGRQNGTWTPLGRPGHPQGPSRMNFPWIFDGIGAENDTLGKGKLATMPLPQGACHNATMLVALATGTAELATLPFAGFGIKSTGRLYFHSQHYYY